MCTTTGGAGPKARGGRKLSAASDAPRCRDRRATGAAGRASEAGEALMKSVCSSCGGELMHDALGACSRCRQALTGAPWALEAPSGHRGVGGDGGGWSRLVLQIAAGMLAGAVASFVLCGLIEAEREAARHASPALSRRQQALRAAPATGLSAARNAAAVPAVNRGVPRDPQWLRARVAHQAVSRRPSDSTTSERASSW